MSKEYYVTDKRDIICTGKTRSFFKVILAHDYFYPNDIVVTASKNIEVVIIREPKQKWYKKLLEYITFSLYTAPWEYNTTVHDR